MRWHKPIEPLEYEAGKEYSKAQKEQIADTLLRQYGKKELCRECLTEGVEEEGGETGHVETIPQFEEGDPLLGEDEVQITSDLPELQCPQGHIWYLGEGKSRGHAGDNPVLFEEHLIQRRRREIYPVDGIPDPSIVSGMYYKTHPQGRKVNTDKARRTQGASFYRVYYFLPLIYIITRIWS